MHSIFVVFSWPRAAGFVLLVAASPVMTAIPALQQELHLMHKCSPLFYRKTNKQKQAVKLKTEGGVSRSLLAGWVLVAHPCNPSDSGGRDQED
jgi:hypothetical protein